jgi:hypothetical protein
MSSDMMWREHVSYEAFNASDLRARALAKLPACEGLDHNDLSDEFVRKLAILSESQFGPDDLGIRLLTLRAVASSAADLAVSARLLAFYRIAS